MTNFHGHDEARIPGHDHYSYCGCHDSHFDLYDCADLS